MTTRFVRMAILGDPHFCVPPASPGSPPSQIAIGVLGSGAPNPWDHLKDLVRRDGLVAGIVLTTGDITTHANPEALKRSWKELMELGDLMRAEVVASATGNHDVRTRSDKVDANPIRALDRVVHPIEALLELAPHYPLVCLPRAADRSFHCLQRTHYFGTDFLIYESTDLRLMVLNSCGRHTLDPQTYERGIFAPYALEELKRQLESAKDDRINVALFHHPPHAHDFGQGLYDQIKGGEELLAALNDHGDWIVIHGHKHQGRIQYSQGGSPTTAPVFAAGSIGATLTPPARNQFYILEATKAGDAAPVGKVRSWNWEGPRGWAETFDLGDGIASGTGFGERRDHRVLAREIATRLGTGSSKWDDLRRSVPWLDHLTTMHLKQVLKTLKEQHSVGHTFHPGTQILDEVGHA